MHEKDAVLVNSVWDYTRRYPAGEQFVAHNINHMPTICIRNTHDDKAVSWCLLHEFGAMGMLHVLTEYRGKGLAQYVVTRLARRLMDSGQQSIYVAVEKQNVTSLELHRKCGFCVTDDIKWMAYWPDLGKTPTVE